MPSQKYHDEQQELDKKIQELKQALSDAKQAEDDAGKWIDLIKRYDQPTELTAELLHTLTEKNPDP